MWAIAIGSPQWWAIMCGAIVLGIVAGSVLFGWVDSGR